MQAEQCQVFPQSDMSFVLSVSVHRGTPVWSIQLYMQNNHLMFNSKKQNKYLNLLAEVTRSPPFCSYVLSYVL